MVLYLPSVLKQMWMATVAKDDVQSFLEQFHGKMKVFGIIYRDDRGRIRKLLKNWRLFLRSGRW